MASTSANDPDSVPTAEEVVSMYLSGLTLAQPTNTDCTTAGDDANEVMIDQSGASGTEGLDLSPVGPTPGENRRGTRRKKRVATKGSKGEDVPGPSETAQTTTEDAGTNKSADASVASQAHKSLESMSSDEGFLLIFLPVTQKERLSLAEAADPGQAKAFEAFRLEMLTWTLKKQANTIACMKRVEEMFTDSTQEPLSSEEWEIYEDLARRFLSFERMRPLVLRAGSGAGSSGVGQSPKAE